MKKLLFLLIISCISFSQDFEIPKFIDFSGIEQLQKYEEKEGNRILEEEGYYYYPELLQVEHKFCTLGNLPSE